MFKRSRKLEETDYRLGFILGRFLSMDTRYSFSDKGIKLPILVDEGIS